MNESNKSGRGGIRTHGGVAPTPVFKTGAFNHSATRPGRAEGNHRTIANSTRRDARSMQGDLDLSPNSYFLGGLDQPALVGSRRGSRARSLADVHHLLALKHKWGATEYAAN